MNSENYELSPAEKRAAEFVAAFVVPATLLGLMWLWVKFTSGFSGGEE